MVVFVDYDQDSYNDAHHHRGGDAAAVLHSYVQPDRSTYLSSVTSSSHAVSKYAPSGGRSGKDAGSEAGSSSDMTKTPNVNAFSAALSCYPVVKELARSVDLNTLDALSRTCRQFRANLSPYRHQLIKVTLRCENEYIETLNELLSEGTAIPDSLKHIIQLMSQDALAAGRLTSSKIGKCARDMVAECRRCSRVVCRNCTIKPPSSVILRNRLRRLCTTCRTVPLIYHLSSSTELPSHPGSDWPVRPPSFTNAAFTRTPCHCEDAVWLCQTCGQSLRNHDTTYRRVWTWRTRYSTYLGGGLGTGIGEGCQGVKCGRGEDCLAAQEIELEVDCDDEAAVGVSDHHHNHGHHAPYAPGRRPSSSHVPTQGDIVHGDRRDNRDDDEPGYLRQEIVGIGGVVKHKVKTRVTVGACVVEYEDERETGRYLRREESREDRSWCGWCWRVVPSKADLEPADM